eukprot:g16302.t2
MRESFTPLHLASEVGHLDVVDRLTEAKADLEAIGGCFSRTPLHLAAEKGHCQVVDRLLAAKAAVEAQDQYGRTPLHLAAESGHPATVDRLVAGGATADYHGDTPWQCARENHKDDVAFLRGATPAVDEEEGWFPLHSATFDNDVEEVEHQLVGANIEDADKRGFTPLHLASEVGHLDVVDRLTEAKADLEAKGGEYSYTPPLHCAAQSGHPATVDRLLAAGAAVDAKDNNGQTPLHYAAHYGRSEAAQRLVDAGADVDAQDVMRTTPWVLARETGKARQMAPVLRPVYVSSLGGHWPERRVIELKEEAEQKLGCKICELIASSGKPLQERLTLEEDGVNCWDHITAVALVPTDPTESTDHHAAQPAISSLDGGYLGAVGALGPRSKYDLQDPQQLIRLFLDAKIGLMRLEYLQEMLAADRRFPRRQEADFEVTAAGLPAIVQPSELQRVEIDAVGNMSMKAKPNLYIDVLDERNLRNADFAPDMKDDAQINVKTPKMISVASPARTTPLHLAALHGHIATVDRLVAAGAAVEAKDFEGWTPLHRAARSGHSEVAQRLVDAGADVDAQNNSGLTPWEVAKREGHETRMAPVLRPVQVGLLSGRTVGCDPEPSRTVRDLLEEAQSKLGTGIHHLVTSSGTTLKEHVTLQEAGIGYDSENSLRWFTCWTLLGLVPRSRCQLQKVEVLRRLHLQLRQRLQCPDKKHQKAKRWKVQVVQVAWMHQGQEKSMAFLMRPYQSERPPTALRAVAIRFLWRRSHLQILLLAASLVNWPTHAAACRKKELKVKALNTPLQIL